MKIKSTAVLILLCPFILCAQTQYGRIQTDQIANKSVITITGATPDVSTGNVFKTNNGSATTVTNFTGGVDSQKIEIICGEANTTIQNNTSISLVSGADFVCTLNATVSLIYSSSAAKWLQFSAAASTGAQTNVVNTFTATQNFNGNVAFKGPNPYVDVTRYGVRAVVNNTAPAIPGITATINSGSSSATISAASSFQNGDGVVIFGAGAAHTMTTPGAPTVTPSVAAAGTGTGIVVNGPAGGATTYNYQIVARDKNGGLTAASTVGTTASGAAALGSQSVAITSISKSGTTNTVTTSSAHGLSVGSMVLVIGTNDAVDFDGWFVVATTTDNTHFTYSNGMDSASGAGTSATGGTAYWFNCNHLSWSAVTGAWEYYIYGRTGGALTLLGVSRPSATYVDLTWDDFGSPMMDGYTAPYFVPTTPPGSATSDHLVTTISSGAGTTTLTLANTAGTSVTGATILFDNAPNILTAANAAKAYANGTLFFPASASLYYCINSYLTLPTGGLAISQAGTILLTDTLEVSPSTRWFGNLAPQGNSAPGFGFEGQSVIYANRAVPGIYSPAASNLSFRGLSFASTTQGAIPMLLDYVFASNFEDVNFTTGPGNNDYMGVSLMFRGDNTNSSYANLLRNVLLTNTQPATQGSSATPAFYCNGCGLTFIDRVNLAKRGLFFKPISAGGNWRIQHSRMQGGIMPYLTVYGGTNYSYSATLEDIELDTMPHAVIAQLTGLQSTVTLINAGYPSSSGSGFPANTTGIALTKLVATNSQTTQNIQASSLDTAFWSNRAVQVNGTNGSIGYQMTVPAAGSAVVSAGGSVPIGSIQYKISALDANGFETLVGPATTVATTTSGNQTITVTPPSAPAGAVLWRPYRSTGGGYQLANIPGGCTATNGISWSSTFVDTFASPCGTSVPTLNTASSAAASSSGLQGQQLVLTGGGFKSTLSGSFTANRTVTVPDATGTVSLAQIYNAAGTLQSSPHIVEDSGTLSSASPSTATITLSGSAVFTSNTSYNCTASNKTTQTNSLKVTYTDGSHFVVTGPNTVTDAFSYICVGN